MAQTGDFLGYRHRTSADPDLELVSTKQGTPCGELFRRFWQPVAMSSRVTSTPCALDILGMKLIVFRTQAGEVGLMHRQCAHRGASLEFGRVESRGIRCSYHGWLYDCRGKLLEAPLEGANSPLCRTVDQGAFPVVEKGGLVFAFLGAAEDRPAFPDIDSLAIPGDDLLPYALHYPCNWLQVHENLMDPLHAIYLHSKIGETHFTKAWGEIPAIEYVERSGRIYYLAARQIGTNVWVRLNEVAAPNFGLIAGLWETGEHECYFDRVSISRWTVPIDDENCWIIGFRHFHPDVEKAGQGLGRRELVGYDSADSYGQTGHRPYAEMQANPGDWEAQVSQGRIAVHALEHRCTSDRGVALLRNNLRKLLRRAPGADVNILRSPSPTNTWTSNTVIPLPHGGTTRINGESLVKIMRRVAEIIQSHDGESGVQRTERVRGELRTEAWETYVR